MKISARTRLVIIILFLLVLAVSFVALRGGSAERIWLKAPDWSRAQIIGTSRINDPASLVIGEGGTIYTFLIAADGEISRPRIMALNPQAEVLWDKTLDVIIDRPDKPRLLWVGQSLWLFWLDSNRLYTAKLDPAGSVLEEPRLLSGTYNVDSYSVANDLAGNISVWYAGARQAPGVYALTLNSSDIEPAMVDMLGIRPAIQYDLEGGLHASWAQHPPGFGEPKILYADYQNGHFSDGQEDTMARPLMAPTSALRGPFLGLDQTTATVIWAVEVRTGTEAGRTDTNYLSFPLGAPELAGEPARLMVPAGLMEEYEPVPGLDLQAGERVSLPPGEYPGTSSLQGIIFNPVITNEMVMAFESTLPHLWRKAASQISTLFSQDGIPVHYQLLSFSRTASSAPAIISDEDGYLYITWIEPGETGFSVYLASTSPTIVESLGSITFKDLRLLTGETIFGLLSGVALSPIVVLLWMIIPLFIIAITGPIRRGNDQLSNPGTIISLGLAFIAYMLIKIATTPEFGVYVPFSAWLPVPEWLQAPLQYLVPVGITIFALWATWKFVYSKGTHSLLFLAALFMVFDGVITLSIYGIIFLGAL